MPVDMFLRSGPGWHLTPSERTRSRPTSRPRATPRGPRPIPVNGFATTPMVPRTQGVEVDERWSPSDPASGNLHRADAGRVDAPTNGSWRPLVSGSFTSLPRGTPGAASSPPAQLRGGSPSTTSPARVAVIGGRKKRYEWAARFCANTAPSRWRWSHRHPTRAFDKVDWAFVDPDVERDTGPAGLVAGAAPPTPEPRSTAEFWRVGRLTLEHGWRRDSAPGVVSNTRRLGGHGSEARTATASRSDGPTQETLGVDHLVSRRASGADLHAVPYLGPILDQVRVIDGGRSSRRPSDVAGGLSVTGFA